MESYQLTPRERYPSTMMPWYAKKKLWGITIANAALRKEEGPRPSIARVKKRCVQPSSQDFVNVWDG